MKREDLDFLEEEQRDKVMAIYGKAINKVKTELENAKSELAESKEKITTYETKINEFNEQSKDNADWKTKYEELQTSIKEQEAKKQAEEQDKILTNNILELFGDKKFTSDYAKNGLLNDIKNGLNLPENKGKGIKEIFDSLTKDRTGIFENENKIQDMAPMQSVDNVSELKGGLDIKLNPMFKNYN